MTNPAVFRPAPVFPASPLPTGGGCSTCTPASTPAAVPKPTGRLREIVAELEAIEAEARETDAALKAILAKICG